ncbi:AAA family ATPase [Roseomonas frigidaquae]|uniref:AAA family ATPase n=1 Tax=Falsiroseomonas frigidaquae TaxID=487318 RepID=A0ABX1EYG8_9PROT|nr:AAA family ATPase [Falsiroseomonas frigidaquae]NKE45150.1 AAA family ATPase [Falsiroseomonas frigidaquae]
MMDGIASPEAEMRADGITTERLAPRRGRGRRMRLLTLAECADAKPRGYLVKGLIAPGDLVVLFGPPGSGKSVLAPYLAHAVAAGRMVFGRRVRPGPVLYIAAEDPEGMKMRATALRAVYGDAKGMRVAAEPVNLQSDGSTEPPDLAAITEAADELGAVLIVLDTVAKAFPGLEENDGRSMGRAVHLLRLLTTRERAVIAVHHGAKPTSNSVHGGSTPRGHGVLNGDADVTMRIEVAEASGIRTVHLGKNRNGVATAQLAFTLRSHALSMDEDGDAVTTVVAEEVDEVAGAQAKAGPALTDATALLLRAIQSLDAEGAGEIAKPQPGMPNVRAIPRSSLREELVRDGWFPEVQILPKPLPSGGVLSTAGYQREHNALMRLQRKGLVGFDRRAVWLAR